MERRYILFFCICILLLQSCKNNNHSKVKDIAYRYSMAMANYQVDNAVEYATQETQQTTLKAAQQMISKIGQDYIESDTPAKIQILHTNIINDTEAYAIYHKTTPIKDFQDTVWLRKRNGQWLVHVLIPIVHRPTQEEINQFEASIKAIGPDGQDIKSIKLPSDLTQK